TPQSSISDEIIFTYPSLDTIAKDPGVLGVQGHFNATKVAVSDLLLFAPRLATIDPFRKNQHAIILVNGDIDGRVDNLDLKDVEMIGPGNIKIRTTGNIVGLPDA